jgi:hypothetical protein
MKTALRTGAPGQLPTVQPGSPQIDLQQGRQQGPGLGGPRPGH